MTRPLFQWKRFWRPREAALNMMDGGYLCDPDSPYGAHVNPELKTIEQLFELPCLVLLGEPGIGKSYTLSVLDDPKRLAARRGDAVRRIDLSTCSSADALSRDFADVMLGGGGRGTSGIVHLFLDNFDEASLNRRVLVGTVEAALRGQDLSRTLLRIVSRSADWSLPLERILTEAWPPGAVAVVELAPLRRIDVGLAASVSGLEPDAFIDAVGRSEAVPLAIRPLTLNFLLAEFAAGSLAATSQTQLFEGGCRTLCDEQSLERLDGAPHPAPLETRLEVAGGIAAAMRLMNRVAVLREPAPAETQGTDIARDDLALAIGLTDDRGVQGVDDVLRSGLFTSRAAGRVGWAHAAYQDFLAARFLVGRGVGRERLRGLLLSGTGPERAVPSQLAGLAGWLAARDESMCDDLLSSDPEAVVFSDAVYDDPGKIALIAQKVLEFASGERFVRHDLEAASCLKRLSYPQLPTLLADYIDDKERAVPARRVAVTIAGECHVKQLAPNLVQLALNSAEPVHLRTRAIDTLGLLGDSNSLAALRPLVNEGGDDPQDELRGAVLQVAYPRVITTSEMLASLAPRKAASYLGSYAMFLSRDMAEAMPAADYPVALSEFLGKWDYVRRAEHLAMALDSLLSKACMHLDTADVYVPFAELALCRIVGRKRVFGDRVLFTHRNPLEERPTERRRLLADIVVGLSAQGVNLRSRLRYLGDLVRSSDLEWLLDQGAHSASKELSEQYLVLAASVADLGDERHLAIMAERANASEAVREGLRWLIGPVELGSPLAAEMKAAYEAEAEGQQSKVAVDATRALFKERVSRDIAECAAAKPENWWQVVTHMAYGGGAYPSVSEYNPSIEECPVWADLSEEVRRSARHAAMAYLHECEPHIGEWGEPPSVDRRGVAGYKALHLVMADATVLPSDPRDVFSRWVPAVMAYPALALEPGDAVDARIVGASFVYAKNAAVEGVKLGLKRATTDDEQHRVLRRVRSCRCDELDAALENMLRESRAADRKYDQLFAYLVESGSEWAITQARDVLGVPGVSQQDDVRALRAAEALLRGVGDQAWDVIWPRVQQSKRFGTELLSRLSEGPTGEASAVLARLSGGARAQVLEFLYSVSDIIEFPLDQPSGWVGREHELLEIRAGLLQEFRDAGTQEAALVVERLAARYADVYELKIARDEARRIARERNWSPPTRDEFKRIITDATSRYVGSGEALLEVVEHSLERLQEQLQGERRMMQFLWNDVNGVRQPKTEVELSDFVAQHLSTDIGGRRVVANREVRLKPRVGGAKGARTDIHLNAFRVTEGGVNTDPILAIIEVKGCWNRDVESALEEQLVRDYMTGTSCRHGLYLVFWFCCEEWDESDSRKRSGWREDLEGHRASLVKSARAASTDNREVRAMVLDAAYPSA